MVNGAKNAAKAKGCEIQNEHQLTINGVPMHAYTTQIADTVSIASYMGFADDVGFSLQGYSKTSDAGADAEITTVLNSFRVLSKTESRPKVAQPDDTAFRFGYVVGCVATLLFVLGLFWMIISKSKRNKNPV